MVSPCKRQCTSGCKMINIIQVAAAAPKDGIKLMDLCDEILLLVIKRVGELETSEGHYVLGLKLAMTNKRMRRLVAEAFYQNICIGASRQERSDVLYSHAWIGAPYARNVVVRAELYSELREMCYCVPICRFLAHQPMHVTQLSLLHPWRHDKNCSSIKKILAHCRSTLTTLIIDLARLSKIIADA